ncbi:pantetheine-phosphate adenylyltransferase [Streptococcus sp. DD13]|uniref:pantetheine-phosphate adenylyltransferase n=1 Tax=Streptococcus sp. DD13 TaxID=1777881 RepID=UPI00079422DB|nr:pantetheine-phosphate adenylyltransferase [Streptococcus sp. DD13]KXT78259.1 Phosphopantetheine adenylyltransferase [Streptococcus sp. DD13]
MSDKIGLVTGSFDPPTKGHLAIIQRASHLFDQLYVGIFYNENKQGLLSLAQRQEILEKVVRDMPNVAIVTSRHRLVVDVARELGVTHLVRGLRNATDLEYENNMEFYNRNLAPEIETVYFTAHASERELSSSRIRELIHFGGDYQPYVPKEVVEVVEGEQE